MRIRSLVVSSCWSSEIATDAPDVQTAEVNFDGITYAKGASVLKQLGAYIGVESFLAPSVERNERSDAALCCVFQLLPLVWWRV